MAPRDPASRRAILVSHLDRLDSQACLAFLAAVWDARGFETRLDDGVLTATRNGRPTVVTPVCRRSLRPSSPRQSDDATPDVVVSFGADRRARALAERYGARYVDSTALVEMLLYALDRPEAARLCTRHLGAPIDELPPPLRTRTRQRVARGGRRITGLGQHVTALARRATRAWGPTPRIGAAFVVFLLVVSGGAVSLGVVDSPLEQRAHSVDDGDAAGPSDEETAAGQSEPTETQASDVGPTTAVPAVWRDPERADIEPVEDGDLDSVPGVSEAGVTNLTALGIAHEAAVSNRNYTLWLDAYFPSNASPNATRTHYDTDVSVAGDRYLVIQNTESGRDRIRLRTVYYDGRDWYVTSLENGTERTARVDGESGAAVQSDPRRLNGLFVRQYLATRTTNVTGKVRVDDTTYYRLEGRGRSSIGGIEPVREYHVVAFVDDSGFVSEATVTYLLVSETGTSRVRYEWTYGNVGSTTVTRPSWVETAEAERETVQADGESDGGVG